MVHGSPIVSKQQQRTTVRVPRTFSFFEYSLPQRLHFTITVSAHSRFPRMKCTFTRHSLGPGSDVVFILFYLAAASEKEEKAFVACFRFLFFSLSSRSALEAQRGNCSTAPRERMSSPVLAGTCAACASKRRGALEQWFAVVQAVPHICVALIFLLFSLAGGVFSAVSLVMSREHVAVHAAGPRPRPQRRLPLAACCPVTSEFLPG